jgi:hypothetical protein
MQKRENDPAVREHWEAGEEIPGLAKFNAVTGSVTKVS